jgi:hypothetical protein
MAIPGWLDLEANVPILFSWSQAGSGKRARRFARPFMEGLGQGRAKPAIGNPNA